MTKTVFIGGYRRSRRLAPHTLSRLTPSVLAITMTITALQFSTVAAQDARDSLATPERELDGAPTIDGDRRDDIGETGRDDGRTNAKPDSLDCLASGHAYKDCSHFVIAAIKSVSGEIPDNEFFAAHWKVRYGEWGFTLASMDIALSKDTTSSSKALTEAGGQINVDISYLWKSGGITHRREGKRSLYGGAGAKIFNAEAYLTSSVGSIELTNSPFEGSYVQFGYARRFFQVTDSTRFNDQKQRLANDNMLFEFLIRSSEVEFFRSIMIRGGVLIPMLRSKGQFDDIQFRITLAVTAGDLFRY